MGDVFTDGSCFKFGPPTWNAAGWAVVKVSADGILLGWAKGGVGTQLPQTSPASEQVAMLATATLAKHTLAAHADYQGIESLEARPLDRISYRKSMYAGVHVEIRGRCPDGFTVHKVQGHVSPESCGSQDEWFEAVGN